jgi:flagellar biosynthesis/type III secretory pathway chaperone
MSATESMDTVSRDVTAILVEQIRCADAMRTALTQEHAALVGGNAGELEAATATKGRLVDALESLESRRRALAGGTTSQDAPEQRELRDLLAECKEQNLRNGALLKARADNVRVALNALRGTGPDLYSARGHATVRSDARPLGTA